MPSRWFSFPLDSSRDMGNPMGNVFDFFISTKSENMQNANPVLRDLHSGPKFCSTRWMDVVDGMGYFLPHKTTYQTILYPFVSPRYMLGNCSQICSIWIAMDFGVLNGIGPIYLEFDKDDEGNSQGNLFFYYIYQSFSRNFFPTNVPHEFWDSSHLVS